MNKDYKRTFDSVKMPHICQEQIRSELSSRLSEKHKEDKLMNEKGYTCKKFRILVIAIIAVLSLSLVGFAFGNQIIKLLGGGRIEQGKNSDGENFTSIDTGFKSDPIKIEDGQIYFILDDSNTNITPQCSDSNYYKYEKTDDKGYRHVVIIGGTADNIGMAEFVWNESGEFIGSNASHNTEEMPLWLKSARTELLQN